MKFGTAIRVGGMVMLSLAPSMARAKSSENSRCLRAAAALVLPPLSPAVSRDFVERALPVIQAQAARLAKKYAFLQMEENEIANEASLYVLDLARAGKLDLGTATPSYVITMIEWRLRNQVQDKQRSAEDHWARLDEPLFENESLSLIDTIAAPRSTGRANQEMQPNYQPQIAALLNTLGLNASKRFGQDPYSVITPRAEQYLPNETTRQVFQAIADLHATQALTNRDVGMLFEIYFNHRSLKDVAPEYRLSPSRTTRIMQESIAKIRARLADPTAKLPVAPLPRRK